MLVRPFADGLEALLDALDRNWSPDNLRAAAGRELAVSVRADPEGYLAACDDPDGVGPPVELPDGTRVPRLPSVTRWIWRDGFAGTIGLRWQAGTEALPPTCLGHIGYAVVPWRRGEGLASLALDAILPRAREAGLAYVDLTTAPYNPASIRVIAKAGGRLLARFEKPPALGGGPGLRFRIDLLPASSASTTPAAPSPEWRIEPPCGR